MEWENVSLNLSGRVGVITLHHPPANALNQATLSSLNAVLDYAENHAEIKVLVLTGAGKFFVAGADIKEIATVEDAVGGKQLACMAKKYSAEWRRFQSRLSQRSTAHVSEAGLSWRWPAISAMRPMKQN